MQILALLLFATIGQPRAGEVPPGTPSAEQRRSGLWIADTAFTPDDIASANQGWEDYSGMPNVIVTFTETGRVKFARVQLGRLEQPLDISIDGEIVSSPILREIITGNQVAIAGGLTTEDAAALARRIAPPRR